MQGGPAPPPPACNSRPGADLAGMCGPSISVGAAGRWHGKTAPSAGAAVARVDSRNPVHGGSNTERFRILPSRSPVGNHDRRDRGPAAAVLEASLRRAIARVSARDAWPARASLGAVSRPDISGGEPVGGVPLGFAGHPSRTPTRRSPAVRQANPSYVNEIGWREYGSSDCRTGAAREGGRVARGCPARRPRGAGARCRGGSRRRARLLGHASRARSRGTI